MDIPYELLAAHMVFDDDDGTLADEVVAPTSGSRVVHAFRRGVTSVALKAASALVLLAALACDNTSAPITGGEDGAPRPEVAYVRITTTTESIGIGETLSLHAEPRDASDRVLTDRPVTWYSTSPTVASVSSDGRVTARVPGDAYIFATIEQKSARAFVHVRAPTIARFEISPADSTIGMDEARQLVARAFDAQGRPVPTPYIQWTSSDPATVSISGEGRVTGIQPGMVEISAVAQGHVARTTLMVALVPWTADLLYLAPPETGVGNARIRIQPLDGRNGTELELPAIESFATIADLAPSPDGAKIAFTATSTPEGVIHRDIWVVNRDGSGLRRLTTDTSALESQPAWSPDGARIAYRSTQGGGTDSDIWVMNADGSGQRNYTSGAASDDMDEEWPAWSPDGRTIAYGALVKPTGHGELWTMRAEGAGRQRLTSDLATYDRAPAWSPDGTQLAFLRVASMNGSDITILTVSGTDAGRVTSLPLAGNQLSPAWSPDGRYLAFASNHAGRFDLFTSRPDGRGLRQRTTNVTAGAYEVTWVKRP